MDAAQIADRINSHPALQAGRLQARVAHSGRVLVDCTRGSARWIAAVIDPAARTYDERGVPMLAVADGRKVRVFRAFESLMAELGLE